jgi:predicted DNA-binding protein
MSAEPVKRLRGEHCLNIFISYELKKRINDLAQRYDRTMADIVRMLMRVGIPIMEGLSRAEEEMMKDYIQLFRKMRKVKEVKDM